MGRINLLAGTALAGVLALGFMGSEHAGLYINSIGLIIVLSGTLGATVLSYPMQDIGAALRVARNSYVSNPPSDVEIVDALLDLAVRRRHHGVLALEDAEEEVTVGFLRNALGMLVDGYKDAEIRDILATEMLYFRKRRDQHVQLFRHMARLAPAFGVAGSVVGLVAMLGDIGDPRTILESVPIALTSTLYGIIIGNLILGPIAESIERKTVKELFVQRLITDGVIAIQGEQNTVKLAKKLNAFLTPASRHAKSHSFNEIRDRYRELRDVVPADMGLQSGRRAPGMQPAR